MRAFAITTIVSLLVVACAAEDANTLNGGRGPGAGGGPGAGDGTGDGTTPGDGTGADPTQPGTCKEGIPHVGFANTDAIAGRVPGAIGVDRRRVKPFSALDSEFKRALGAAPAGLAGSAAAYGDVPDRWFAEPTAGGISTYLTYDLAFTGCFDTMTDPKFAQAPSATSAPAECATMQRKYWQRSATPDETKACADFVLGLTGEPVPRRLWAHACAAIMTSAGFTTY